MKNHYLGFALILGILGTLVAAILFFYQREIRVPAEYRLQQADIQSILDKAEAHEAYRLFRERYTSLPQAEQHQAAHIFGEALYERGGIDLFSVCDSSFGFGCFHSFISLALKEHGESIAQELDAKCIQAYGEQGLGCSHGVGHGLLSYFGYDLAALTKALSLCEGLTWDHPYGGCRDGVFMEYDFQTMAQGDGGSLRRVDPMKPHAPCTEIDRKSRVACFFGLPSLWISSKSTTLAGMEEWCKRIEAKEERWACFRGIGYGYAPQVSFSAPEMIGICDGISDRDGRLRCRQGGAWMLYADPALRDNAVTLCTEGLSEAESTECKNGYLFVLQ